MGWASPAGVWRGARRDCAGPGAAPGTKRDGERAADNRLERPSAQSKAPSLIDKIWTAFVRYPALFGMPALLARLPRGHGGDPSHVQFVRRAIGRDGGVAAGLRRRGAGRGRDLGRHRPVDRIRHGGRERARGKHDEETRASASRSLLAAAILVAGAAIGAVNGLLVIVSRVPDVIVTLTTGFIWGGVALLILEKPGGGALPNSSISAPARSSPSGCPIRWFCLSCRLGVVWIPVRMSKTGLRIYATGSDRDRRVSQRRQCRARAALRLCPRRACSARSAGSGLTMTTGIGSPHAGVLYTLSGLAAVVIGGVSLTGGRGGIVGPVIAAFVLTLIPADLIFLNIDPNFGQVIQGTLIVLVVMAGGLVTPW